MGRNGKSCSHSFIPCLDPRFHLCRSCGSIEAVGETREEIRKNDDDLFRMGMTNHWRKVLEPKKQKGIVIRHRFHQWESTSISYVLCCWVCGKTKVFFLE